MVIGHNVEETDEIESLPTSLSDGPMDSPWPMKCHDNRHTGRSLYNTPDSILIEKWRFTCDKVEGGSVIDNQGIIYFGDFDNILYALYPNGTLKWEFDLGPAGWIYSCPSIAEDGTIYVTSYDDYLHAVNPNGTEKWKFCAYDSITSSPAVDSDGTIYFGSMGPGNDGRIFAIYPNGTEKWHYDTGYWITSDPAIGDDGTIYIGSGDEYIYAMNPNGTLRWRFKTGYYVKGPPSIAEDGTVYIGSWDGYLYALYSNGTMKWTCGIGSGTETNPSISSDGTIYVGYNALYAVYPNGTIKWIFDLGQDRIIHQSSPAISADDKIYIGTKIGEGAGGEIIVINSDGSENWRSEIIANDWVDTSPSIAEDGTIYIGSTSNDAGYSYGYLHSFGRGDLEADANGPYVGIINEPVQFTGSADGGYPPYGYHWDFGDDEASDEQNPTHEYTAAGNYTVTLTVTDDEDNISVDITWALIYESNDPPNMPIITGETHGHYGESYDYTFVSTDPEDQDVWYYIEWGDGDTEEWIGPYSSGEEIVRLHTWDDRGEYTIRAKARDIFEEESDWAYLEVTMPVNQQSSYPWLNWFLERFPNAFPIFRSLIGSK